MEYTVSKGSPGKRQVSFSCPACQDRLKTPLESAGQEVECPTCGHLLLIPGVAELQAQQAEQAASQQAADQLRQPHPNAPQAGPASAGAVPASPVRAPSPIGFNAPRSATLSSQTTTPQQVAIPQYRGLLMAKSVFWVLAMLLYIVAAVGLVAGLLVIIMTSTPTIGAHGDSTRSVILGNIAFVVAGAIGTAFYGFLLHVVGELVGAVRDIAMNSFRR